MTNLLLFILLTFLLPAGDEKILKQVNSQIAKGDYQKAATVLEKVSTDGKTVLPYLQSAALVYDSLRSFSQAVSAYELLLAESENKNAIVDRIAFLNHEIAKSNEAERERLEKMKNCIKCGGTGYFETTETCPKCDGYHVVTKDCQRCQGMGRINCSSCDGTGKTAVEYDGRKVEMACSRCNGTGYFKCPNQCNNGKVTEDCRKCGATGMVSVRKKCDLH